MWLDGTCLAVIEAALLGRGIHGLAHLVRPTAFRDIGGAFEANQREVAFGGA